MSQSCDLCGAPEARYLAKVAGTETIACERCASHGVIIEELREAPKPSEIKRIERQNQEIIPRTEEVIENIGEIVRAKREENAWKQEDLGKKASEHASMIKRIEHGYIPSLQIAHKLEKVLHVKLTEMASDEEQGVPSAKSGGSLTLGDIMVVRKEKR
jgi:uncharacterized protein (TIGR00270 family)